MSKQTLYLLAFLLLGSAGSAQAGTTKFTDVNCRNMTVTGTLTSGGCTCTNISTTTLTSASIVTSTLTLSGYQGLRLSAGSIVITAAPAAANILAHDSNYVLYISTSTGAGAWVKVGGQ